MSIMDDNIDIFEEINLLKAEWFKEVNIKKKEINNGECNSNPYRIELAHKIYVSGQKAELKGYLQIAVEQYRRATYLVDDIDINLISNDNQMIIDSNKNDEKDISSDLLNDRSNCDLDNPELDENTPPILRLPDEILFYIMRWIVGANLDIYSLLLVGLVCQKFLSVSTDEQLWRLICLRLWPSCTVSDLHNFGGSWISMAKTRPHLLFHGCYISSISYMRKGEHTVNTVTPFLLVRYFRVFRFRADGSVIMVTSAQDPKDIILLIRSLDQNALNAKLSSLLGNYNIAIGKYTMNNDMVHLKLIRATSETCSLHASKRTRKTLNDESSKDHLDISFQIKRSKRRPNTAMRWRTFSLTLERRNDLSVTNYDTNSDIFPKIIFSRVHEFCSRLPSEHL